MTVPGRRSNKTATRLVIAALVAACVPLAMAGQDANASSVSINENYSEEDLDALGFDIDSTQIEAYMSDAANEPFSDEPFSLLTVNELTEHSSGGLKTYDYSDQSGVVAAVDLARAATSSGGSALAAGDSAGARSVAFRAAGSDTARPENKARDKYIAEIRSYRWNDKDGHGCTRFVLTVYDGETKALLASKDLGWIQLQPEAHQIGAFLEIAAGDYDGDGWDEIAIYNPAVRWNYTATGSNSPRVDIYRFTDSNGSGALALVTKKYIGGRYWDETRGVIGGGTNAIAPHLASFVTSVQAEDNKVLDSPSWKRDHVNHFPAVSLATVENTMDGCDDLAIAVSESRSADSRDHDADDNYGGDTGFNQGGRNQVAELTVWLNPVADSAVAASSLQHFPLWDNWASAYNAGSAYYLHNEKMIFPGVAAGDIDGDGLPELVVAGYRMLDAYVGAGGTYNWRMDEDRFLVATLDYTVDSAKNEQGKVSIAAAYARTGPMQWVATETSGNEDGANGNLHMNEAVRQYQGSTDADNMMDPLAVAVFAENGALGTNGGFPRDSIFVGGYILSEFGLSAGSYLYLTTAKGPGDGVLASGASKGSKTLAVKYAFPLEFVDDSRYGFVSDSGKKGIKEVITGNFNGNPDGREQLIFTYQLQRAGANAGQFVTVLCAIDKLSEAQVTPVNNPITDRTGSWKTDAARYFTGASISFRSVQKNNDTTGYTAAASDVDNDSSIVRPARSGPEFYFSDPKVVAILQAAPYFEDVEYFAVPETSITAKSGSGGSQSDGIEFSASVKLGFEIEFGGSVGFIAGCDTKLFGIRAEAGITGGAGYEHATEIVNTISTTFAAGRYHTVVLNTTPYVRYYYEQWDPASQSWKDLHVDMPRTPQLQQMPVADYDAALGTLNSANPASGLVKIGETFLAGIVAGDPTTYPSQKPAASWSDVGQGMASQDQWFAIGTGDGVTRRGIAREITWSDTASYSAGIAGSFSFQVAYFSMTADAELSYNGAHSSISLKGTEYEAVVPELPPGKKLTHDFKWQFGTYAVDLADPSNDSVAIDASQDGLVTFADRAGSSAAVVLGYRVKDALSPPRPPGDLAVISTSTSQVTLDWSASHFGGVVDRYELAVIGQDGEPYVLESFAASSGATVYKAFTYTHSGLRSGTAYEYSVRAVSKTAGGRDNVGEWSPAVKVVTLREGGPRLSQQPVDVYALTGSDAVFAV
ncbi:MAG: fibronectin type III domain-containing protein, partial [Bifidobacteriaceae bacterium]|nr:fibronectin type III domain-containing protein [Bifidobacteriaceae bacterium]